MTRYWLDSINVYWMNRCDVTVCYVVTGVSLVIWSSMVVINVGDERHTHAHTHTYTTPQHSTTQHNTHILINKHLPFCRWYAHANTADVLCTGQPNISALCNNARQTRYSALPAGATAPRVSRGGHPVQSSKLWHTSYSSCCSAPVSGECADNTNIYQ